MSGITLASSFPIPSSLQDLERSPYNLLPYPVGFEDDDEATRADSFDYLVRLVERGNKTLNNGGIALFETPDGEEGFTEWNDDERIQALYTLVRKSTSLAPTTRSRLVSALCEAIKNLSSILASLSGSSSAPNDIHESSQDDQNVGYVVSQAFRDAFACHLYMLYSIMFFVESEAKVAKSLGNIGTKGKNSNSNKKESAKKEKERKAEAEKIAASREACAMAMLAAAQAMSEHKSKLWIRGVPDEDVVTLPCRIAYQMLESATGVVARKASCADAAMGMIAATASSADHLLSTIVTALLDLLHSFEHIAPLVAELCCMVSENSRDKLALELLREIGHMTIKHDMMADAGRKASGIKNLAPFLNELAERKPQFVLEHISLVLPHLNSEPYNLRSAIVTAIGHILVRCNDKKEATSQNDENTEEIFEEELRKKKKISKIKDSLYDILTERAYDVSSFTRVSVLKSWAILIESQLLPIQRLIPLTSLAIDRLQDKTVMVRRSAMHILGLLLENNPFTDSLCPEPYEKKLSEVKSYILENMQEDLKAAKESALNELEEEESSNTKTRGEIEAASIRAAVAEWEGSVDLAERDSEFSAKVNALHFLESALTFIDMFESATGAFESMLLSSNSSDVTEALRFFVRAKHFQLPCAVTGIKQALSLMWSNEKGIQDEVLNAFLEVFIAVPGTEGQELLSSDKIADNLLLLVNKASASEIASIEEAMCRLVKDEVIPADVFLILWSIAAKSTGPARASALLIISMGASADPSIVDSASRLRYLLEAGLGEYTENHRDWSTVRSAAIALQRVRKAPTDPNSAKFIVLEQITEQLCAIIQGDWCQDDDTIGTKAWFGAAEQAINAIFVISPEPERISREVILTLEGTTFGFLQQVHKKNCHSLCLSRFFFVVSHVALKLLVYTEALSSAVRCGNAARALSKQEAADKAKILKTSSLEGDSEDDDDIEAELGVAQAAEAETENQLAEITEKEIIGRGIIGLFTPLLLQIIKNEDGKFSSEILMESSTLALCKFMSISSSFCEKHLPLLFTALANAPSKNVTLRANTVIALGDLAFRFPNEIEPYTPRLYAFLRDKSTRVRRHTLMVLTHLILNDMVKVKGQVCEIALCLQDSEVRIRDMARLLFHELSKRSNNPIYNLLPDIVSRLSKISIKKEDFRSIMAFLLSYIRKDRQTEMLVEKLCQRFPKCSSISQKADIAFCLSQLKINGNCVKILCDQFKLYKDALFDEDVLRNFFSVVSKAKKNINKPEMKEFLEEWENKLKNDSAASIENELAGNKADRAKLRAAKRAGRDASKRIQKPVHKHRKNCEVDYCEDSDFKPISNKGDMSDTLNKENEIP